MRIYPDTTVDYEFAELGTLGYTGTHNGKTWDSLIANNTFTPGVANWREFVEDGFPAWLQPTGAGDAYPVGFRVSHLSQNWQNTSPANTFAPGVFGWTVV